MFLEKDHSKLSISRQCELLEIARSTAYYSTKVNPEDIRIMDEIDRIYTAHPFYGGRRIRILLQKQGQIVGRKRIRRLMHTMGIEAIVPRKNTSQKNPNHPIYPYLLRNMNIERVNQVWSTDITYVRLLQGFVYLVAIMDWYSRYILSWRVSISLDRAFCLEALDEALKTNLPTIFNSDQGCQFTSQDFTQRLEEREVKISMDSKGRCHDNIFVERLWRSVKYEDIYLKKYATPIEAKAGLKGYFHFYNFERPHQALNYKTPAEIYFQTLT